MRSSGHRLAAAALMGLTASFALPAAAETDADLSKYCRATFPNSSPVTRAPSGAIAHYCNQGGTLQGIDLARACELTTGSRVYRQSGERILCEDGPGAAAASGEALTVDDFVRYCRAKFPNSSYQHVQGQRTGQHACRQVGGPVGFTLQPIDLADACRTLKGAGVYREEGARVLCESGSTQTANRAAVGAGPASTAPDRQTSSPASSPPSSSSSGSPTADQNGGGASKQAANEPGQAPDGVYGLWEMRVGTLPGAKIRITQSGDRLTGVVEEIPPSTMPYFNQFTALEIGGVLFVAELSGDKVTGRTPLGISGLRNPSPHPAVCGAAIKDYRSNQQKWPQLEATLDGNRLVGRYRGINLWFQQGACRPNPFGDHPPLVQAGWVKFELERVVEDCPAVPTDVPPLGLTQLLQDKRNQALGAARAQLGQAKP